MFVKSLPVLALAVAAVNGSPVNQIRQVASSAASGVSSVVASGVSSVVSGASSVAVPSSVASGASSVVSGASSAVSGAPSAASSGASSASSLASSAVATATAAVPTNGTSGNQTYPAYPCPAGYLLTYVEQNVTIPAPFPAVRSAFGTWANSSIFGSLVVNTTGSGVGSSHFLNLQGVVVEETLVNVSETAASRILTWNLTNGPIEAMGVGVSNYSTVLSLYDPDYETTNTIGNSTTALTFTNFCATSQAEGMTLVMSLGALELGQLQQALAGGASANATSSSAVASSAAPTSSRAANMTGSMSMSMTALPSSVASSVAASGSSAVVSASSAVASLVNMTSTSA